MANFFLSHFFKLLPNPGKYLNSHKNNFEDRIPTLQNQLDIFEGSWSCELPVEVNASSGGWAKTFLDPKIKWFIEKIGGVQGLRGLELGPLEGGHSWMLHSNEIKSLVSVESNKQAFLKCLIVKNILQMDKVEFKYGDFVSYLESTAELFDFIIASGVLYHLKNPIKALELILSKSHSVLIWTHYYDKELIKNNRDQRKKLKNLKPLMYNNKMYKSARYSYQEATKWSGFCGGMTNDVIWYEKSLYLDICVSHGFIIEIFKEEPNHPHGPAICFRALMR